MTRKATKLESYIYGADGVWGEGCGVCEGIVNYLDAKGMTITMTPEDYYANEFGVDSPEYEDADFDEFSSISVFTDLGRKELLRVSAELSAGDLTIPDKYLDVGPLTTLRTPERTEK